MFIPRHYLTYKRVFIVFATNALNSYAIAKPGIQAPVQRFAQRVKAVC